MSVALDARLLAALERALQQRAVALARSIHRAALERGGDVPGEAEVTDRKDLAERRQRLALRDAEDERDRGELREVQAALARLGRGGFGLCTDCGEPIGAERLTAEPWASRCLRCQTRSEADTARV